jgi:hypothetical protein
MATVHKLSRQDARRVAIRAQLLQRDRPKIDREIADLATWLNLDLRATPDRWSSR